MGGALEPTRTLFSKEQIGALRKTVARDCSDSEFVVFAEIASRYGLDPFAREIYAAKLPGRNGDGGNVVIIVGRDGYLKIARSHPDFEGMDSDVVRAKDAFKVVKGPDGVRRVLHEYEGGADARGPIVGAWAEVYRRGHRTPYYAFAPLREYKPTSERKLQYSPWGAQESVMITKCAIVSALRIAFGISGIYDEAEVARAQEQGVPSEPEEVTVEWGDDPDFASWLMALVAEANRVKPDTFRPAKLAMKLNGRSQQEREAFAGEVEEFVLANGGTPPEPVPVDAEVVSG